MVFLVLCWNSLTMGYQTMFDLDFSEAVSYEREGINLYRSCSFNKSTNQIYKSNFSI